MVAIVHDDRAGGLDDQRDIRSGLRRQGLVQVEEFPKCRSFDSSPHGRRPIRGDPYPLTPSTFHCRRGQIVIVNIGVDLLPLLIDGGLVGDDEVGGFGVDHAQTLAWSWVSIPAGEFSRELRGP